jgi:hypothetical protein
MLQPLSRAPVPGKSKQASLGNAVCTVGVSETSLQLSDGDVPPDRDMTLLVLSIPAGSRRPGDVL